MAQQRISHVALCPECDGPVHLGGRLHVGQILLCRRCGSPVMLAARKPLELVLVNGKRPGDGYVKANKKKTIGKVAAQAYQKQIDELKENPLMFTTTQVYMADCPECEVRLRFHKPLKLGQFVVCPECEEALEVVSLRPLELNWAYEDPGDYEEYDDHRYHARMGID